MKNPHPYLLGARSIRERVVEEYVRVTWIIGRPEPGAPVVYGDDLMVMIFDFSLQAVHVISKEVYVRYHMTTVHDLDIAIHVDLELTRRVVVSATTKVSAETINGWYELMRQHGDIPAHKLKKLLTR